MTVKNSADRHAESGNGLGTSHYCGGPPAWTDNTTRLEDREFHERKADDKTVALDYHFTTRKSKKCLKK